MKTSNNSVVTKQDLQQLKGELKGDIQRLDRKIYGVEKVLRFEIKQSANETKEELKEEMSKNTSKILDTFDKFVKEIITSREERTVVAGRLSEQSDKIERVEKDIEKLKTHIFPH